MQPTKLPDELFDDEVWQAADYPRRVALLLQRFQHVRTLAVELARDGIAVTGCADLLRAELRTVREVNAQLVLEIQRLRPRPMTVPD